MSSSMGVGSGGSSGGNAGNNATDLSRRKVSTINAPTASSQARTGRKQSFTASSVTPTALAALQLSAIPEHSLDVDSVHGGMNGPSSLEVEDSRKLIRINKPARKLHRVFTGWALRIQRTRLLTLSRAFFRWQRFSMDVPALLSTTSTSSGASNTVNNSAEGATTNTTESERRQNENRTQYLALFSENEGLRDQLSETKRTAAAKIRLLRSHLLRSVVLGLARKIALHRVQHYFSRWCSQTIKSKVLDDISDAQKEVAIGRKQIEREREHVKNMEDTLASLRLTLSGVVFFYHWKSHTQRLKLEEERTEADTQRRKIYRELLRLRAGVAATNDMESTRLYRATQRGAHTSSSLQNLQAKLAQVVEVSQYYQQMHQHQLASQTLDTKTDSTAIASILSPNSKS